MSDEDSPNKSIDKAIKKMLKDAEKEPMDMQVKIVNCAVNWEKCKHNIREPDDPFDPDQM